MQEDLSQLSQCKPALWSIAIHASPPKCRASAYCDDACESDEGLSPLRPPSPRSSAAAKDVSMHEEEEIRHSVEAHEPPTKSEILQHQKELTVISLSARSESPLPVRLTEVHLSDEIQTRRGASPTNGHPVSTSSVSAQPVDCQSGAPAKL